MATQVTAFPLAQEVSNEGRSCPFETQLTPQVWLGIVWHLGRFPINITHGALNWEFINEGMQCAAVRSCVSYLSDVITGESLCCMISSADDLVNHCYAMGYGKASNNGSQNASTQGSLTISAWRFIWLPLTMVSEPTAITISDKDETTHMSPFAQMDTILAFNASTPGSSTDGGLQLAV